jgi:hypothetical protein
LLEAKGIKYSHQNDKMIVENPAEKERVEKTIKVCAAFHLHNPISRGIIRSKSARELSHDASLLRRRSQVPSTNGRRSASITNHRPPLNRGT